MKLLIACESPYFVSKRESLTFAYFFFKSKLKVNETGTMRNVGVV